MDDTEIVWKGKFAAKVKEENERLESQKELMAFLKSRRNPHQKLSNCVLG